MRSKLVLAVLLAVSVAASSGFSPTPSRGRAEKALAAPAAPEVRLTPIAGPLSGVTAITNAGDERLFITLQNGRILIRENGAVLATPFLDVSTRIVCCGEQGLLSTAFHPDYASNGFFYVNYTDLEGDTVIARYEVSTGDPNVADPFSGVTLLTIDQPFDNHNGGQLQFGPDGMLYVGMGDGGSANDPDCYAQRMEPQEGRRELLGKLLRLDPDQNVQTEPYYGIPEGNPYVESGGPDEAWAIGLRNPWRFSFDRVNGELFIGDVGQGALEEVDRRPVTSTGGENYGWKMMEGTECTGNEGNCPAVPACDSPVLTYPILEYSHDGGRCSITGGYVYRGLSIPDLYGSYVYGDYCTGEIWAASGSGDEWVEELLAIEADSLTTFGEDAAGELYLGTANGFVYRIDGVTPGTPIIDSVSPVQGYARGGEMVVILGAGFTGGAVVLFGSTPATGVTVVSPTEIRALAPAHAIGVVDITVENPGAPPSVEPGAFTFVDVPRVTPSARETRVLTRP
jgi:glucose/arabinose dehydrogenase